jgi:hypothetical protein
MKAITLLATLAITISSCNCQKKVANSAAISQNTATNSNTINEKTQSKMPTIYYEASTRGYFMACKVENQMLYVTKERNFKEYANKIEISNDDWETISKLAAAVDLEKVKDYKWPTEKRHYDAAAHANIIFESNGVKYPANGFDHGDPPVEVAALVNKIVDLVKVKE